MEVETGKTCLKRPLKKNTKLIFNTDYRLMQVESISECSKGAFCNTFHLHLATIFHYDLCVGRVRQVDILYCICNPPKILPLGLLSIKHM